MGIFAFEKRNREEELQNEIDSKDILIIQNQKKTVKKSKWIVTN